MKVEKVDYMWAAVSMVIVGVSYRRGELIFGLLLIYAMMVPIFLNHIAKIKKRMAGSIAVFGTIADYHSSKGRKNSYFPIVKYETETGREIVSAYSIEQKKKEFEIGDEEMICYSPDDPMFFYFANREWEMTRDYYRFIIIGGAFALILLFFMLAKQF